MTVVAGYLRMLLKDRAGPLSDQQRRLLEEAEKSCGRLSALLAEMSDLSALEAGTAPFNKSTMDLRQVLRDAVATLPEVPEREIAVELATGDGPAIIVGDPARLKTAFGAILHGLRRELVTSTRLVVHEAAREEGGSRASWIAIADDEHVEPLRSAAPDALGTFDEWRGGCGLSLAIARRVIAAHGGALFAPPDGAKAAATVMIPHA